MNKRSAVMLDADTFACELVQPQCVDEWHVHHQTAAAETPARIADCEVIFTNKVALRANDIAAAQQLKLIVIAATGYDIVDLDACRERSIAVANSPGYSVSSVPEHALALMFAVARSLAPLGTAASNGSWSRSPIFCLHDYPLIELAGKTVGIIGAGSLGRATGALCAGIGMNVVYATKHDGSSDDLTRLPLSELLSSSDIISLHCPLGASNANLINDTTIAQMRTGAILINTSRGSLVDAAALIAALESGKLAGAGIDVLDHEPPPENHPLVQCNHPGLLVTPHVAWASQEAQQRLATMIASTADSFFAGNPVYIVS